MINILVAIHVLLGTLAVLGMVVAWSAKKGGTWHRRGGKAYVLGMGGAICFALIVSVATKNVFLSFIGLFSGYLVFTGYRVALARDSIRTTLDKSVTYFLLVTGFSMLAYAAFVYAQESSMGIILSVFGAISIAQSYSDFRRGNQWPVGKERIVLHLNRMGGASIATVTAVLVVNVQTDPAFIAWLLPTLVGTALITYWTIRTRGPRTNRAAQ